MSLDFLSNVASVLLKSNLVPWELFLNHPPSLQISPMLKNIISIPNLLSHVASVLRGNKCATNKQLKYF